MITKKKNMHVWDLSVLYKNDADPQIEKDVVQFELANDAFAKRFDTASKEFLQNEDRLLEALLEYEKIAKLWAGKPLLYFHYVRDIESTNKVASEKIQLLANRFTKANNKTKFFEISLGALPTETKTKFLSSPKLSRFAYFLWCIFENSKYNLSIKEEQILSLKSLPGEDMWVSHTQRILNKRMVVWKKKSISMAEALNMVPSLKSQKERNSLHNSILKELEDIGEFAEGEINAIMTNKKIDDELRGFDKPYQGTVLSYRNGMSVVENLVKTTTDNFSLAHRFFRIKAKLLKRKKLLYSDRAARVGTLKKSFTFQDSHKSLRETFGKIDQKYSEILDEYINKRQIDCFPRQGKRSGAYCWGSYGNPTFVMLNHIDDLNSYSTFAHEMGHAFHTEASRIQGPFYRDYSISLAETASTLFEAIALDAILDKLTDKEKMIVLHDKISDDISTIMRQIACFNFEVDLHAAVRSKGYISKDDIAELHNKNMKAYLGPSFDLDIKDGYMFVQWGHIRRFFYVYTYAYGMLVSKALLRRYREDKNFWKKIEQFLSAGGSATPENILKSIGIDLSSPQIFEEGFLEIKRDIDRLEKLIQKK